MELDKFVISFLIDNKKLNDSVKQANQSITGMIQGIDKGFKTLMTTFAIGFSLNMAKNLVEGFSKVGSSLLYTSKSLGVNVKSLNQWQELAKRVGGTAEGMSSDFSTLRNAITQADFTGGNQTVMALQQLGVATKDSHGNFRDLTQVMDDVHASFQRLNKDQQRKMGSVLGLDDATLRIMQLNNKEYKSYNDEIKRNGLISQAQAERAGQVDRMFASLNQTWTQTKFVLGEQLAPIFEKLTKYFLDFAQNTLPKLINQFKEWKSQLGISDDMLIKVGVGFVAFAGIAVIIGGITTALGFMTTGLTLAMAALAPLVVGLTTLYTAYQMYEMFKNKNNPAQIAELTKKAQDVKSGKGIGGMASKGLDWLRNQVPNFNGISQNKWIKDPTGSAIAWAQSLKESGNNPNAIGDNGKSFGTFQIQKNAAKDILGYEPTASQLQNPEFNKMVRDKYMALGMQKAGGDTMGALAFYNGGYKGLEHYKKTGRTFNGYGESIMSASRGYNPASLSGSNVSNTTRNANTKVSIGQVSMHGVQDPQGMYKGLLDHMPMGFDSGRLA